MILHTLNDSYDNLDEDLKAKITFEQFKMLIDYYRKENEKLKINIKNYYLEKKKIYLQDQKA